MKLGLLIMKKKVSKSSIILFSKKSMQFFKNFFNHMKNFIELFKLSEKITILILKKIELIILKIS